MTSSENTSSLLKLAFERVEEWKQSGLIVDNLKKLVEESDDISELLIDLEILVQKSSELQKRISSLPEKSRNVKIKSWQTECLNPLNYEKVNTEYLTWAKEHRVWEVTMFNSLDRWLDLSLENEYNDVLYRIDTLDVSSQATIRPFTNRLSNPSEFSEIQKMLKVAEQSEQKQRETIRFAVEALSKSGIETKSLDEYPLMEAVSVVEQLQSYVETSKKLKLVVRDRIQPFDDDLSTLYVKKIDERLQESPEGLDDLFEELYAVVDNFEERLNKMNSILKEWKQKGVFFENITRIGKHELIHWEENLEKTSEIIESQLDSIKQGEMFEKVWPGESNRLSELKGNLDKVEEYNLELTNLKQRWKEYELRLASLIQKWQFYGIDMKRWGNRSDEEPRRAYNLLVKQEHVLQRVAELIQALEGMDVSFEGKELVEQRLEFIRTQDLSLEEVELMSEWVQSQLKRRARHRQMLEKEWLKLQRNGNISSDANTLEWTLSEFEQMIARAEKGEHIPDLNYSSKSRDSKQTRMKRNAEAQITRWKAEGWDVTGLENLLEKSVQDVARTLVRIRSDVEYYPSLRRRLQMLPWHKNRDVALEVEQMSAKPEMLGELKSKFPTWVRRLATSPDGNKEYEISLFSPKTGRMTLLPVTEHVNDAGSDKSEIVDPQSDSHTLTNQDFSVFEETYEDENQKDELTEQEAEEKSKILNEESSASVLNELEPVEIEEYAEDEANVSRDTGGFDQDDEPRDEPSNSRIDDNESSESMNAEVRSSVSISPSPDVIIQTAYLKTVSSFLNKIGLDEIASRVSDEDFLKSARRGLASMVGIEPRDSRVDRLLRLGLRLLPIGNSEDEKRITLLNALIPAIDVHHTWTKKRLQARRGQGTGDYLHDSALLGSALERIPGPGFFVPLSKDTYEMPDLDNLSELSGVTLELAKAMSLPTAGGIR